MQVKFKLKLKTGDIDLVSERSISDEELESIRKELEPISQLLLLGEGSATYTEANSYTEEYIKDRKEFILCMGEYSDQTALLLDLNDQGYTSDGVYIYAKGEKIAKFNFIGRWIELSPKLRNLPVALIWTFPETFSIWYGDYYTDIKKCREWTSTGLTETNTNQWSKDE